MWTTPQKLPNICKSAIKKTPFLRGVSVFFSGFKPFPEKKTNGPLWIIPKEWLPTATSAHHSQVGRQARDHLHRGNLPQYLGKTWIY